MQTIRLSIHHYCMCVRVAHKYTRVHLHTHIPAADAGFRRGGGGGGGGHACGRDPKHSQLGGMGERCKLPHRGLGQSPRSQRFLRFKTFQNYT